MQFYFIFLNAQKSHKNKNAFEYKSLYDNEEVMLLKPAPLHF